MRSLLYIDSSYTLTEIRERSLNHVLNIRHVKGYWERVISAHPLDMRAKTAETEFRFGPTKIEMLDDNHQFVRGRFGRFAALSKVPFLNSLLALLDFWLRLIRLIRKHKIDAVRAGDPLLCGLLGLGISRLFRTPLVVRIPANNDMIRSSTDKPIQARFTRSIFVEEWIERFVISRADVIISPSSNYADFAVSKGADRAKIHIVPYGGIVEPDHLLPPQDRPELRDFQLVDRLKERKWLAHIGRLSEIKHIEDCLSVLEELASQSLDAGLLLIGDGPLRDKLKLRVKTAGLNDRVIFLGSVSQSELIALLPYVSVVLSPLTGRALAEAAFAARPIVAYDLDWQGDLIKNEETGLLVPARDVVAMAAGVRRLLGDPDFAAAVGDAVRKKAMVMLSPEAAYVSELTAYKALGLPRGLS